jgi:hypothetical protein
MRDRACQRAAGVPGGGSISSNGKPAPQPDKHHEPRGIAIKLIGVPGRKLLPGQEDAVTRTFWRRAIR